MRLLCAINAYGDVGMSELGRLLQLEKSNVSNLVDRLEQRGLVVRTRDAHDRRVTYAELTDEGRELAVGCHAEVVAQLNLLAGKLPVPDRDHLADAVGRMMQ